MKYKYSGNPRKFIPTEKHDDPGSNPGRGIETCENCGNLEKCHPITFWNNKVLAYDVCKKFKPHSPQDGKSGEPKDTPSDESSKKAFVLPEGTHTHEKSLSDKIQDLTCKDGHHPTIFCNWIHLQDVKEAVKRLKDYIKVKRNIKKQVQTYLIKEIDKIFGDDLVK